MDYEEHDPENIVCDRCGFEGIDIIVRWGGDVMGWHCPECQARGFADDL